MPIKKVRSSASFVLPTLQRKIMQIGFSDLAKIDNGDMWPIALTLKELNAATEERIAGLVKKAVSQ